MFKYKIEKKPTYWHCIFYSGCYSDASESHTIIKANSPEEAFEFWKELTKENISDCYSGIEFDYLGGTVVINNPKTTRENSDEWIDNDHNTLTIEMLGIIYVSEI